jgi:hypothetical protein
MATATKDGLYPALLEVQKAAPQLRKDAKAEVPTKSGGKYTYTYLTLETLLDLLRPALTANGLVVVQAPTHLDGHPALRTRLVHAPTGEEIEEVTPLLLAPGSDSQAWGGAITYTRRYSLISMLGLAAEDDDGQSAKPKQNGHSKQPFQAPTGRKIANGRRTKLDALIANLVAAEAMKPEHVEAWCEKRGTTYADITTGLADELEESLVKLAGTVGV